MQEKCDIHSFWYR